MKKTPSRITKKSGKKGCLCDNGTYHPDCCDGTIWAEGIGIIQGGHESTITNNAVQRTNIKSHG